jgi:nucleotide-binding universal stress UspA family protein
VRLTGKLFEAVSARVQRRRPCDLYHSALVVVAPEGRFVIEQTPIPDTHGDQRGVVLEGPVGSRLAGRFRLFRYEVRRWRDGVIPDIAEAVSSPVRMTDDPVRASRILDLAPSVPTLVWGRDEGHTGDMWNSNSVISWLLASAGLDPGGIQPASGGRAPGWRAGLEIAARDTARPTLVKADGGGRLSRSSIAGRGRPWGDRLPGTSGFKGRCRSAGRHARGAVSEKEASAVFERILLAANGSRSSRKAAEVAADIGQKYGAEIVVLHVVEQQITPFGAYVVEQPYQDANFVEEIVRALKDAGVSARSEIQTAPLGSVPHVILDMAKELDAGLIVMGSRGLSEWEGLFLASVSHRVLHLAQCPVFVVR